MVKLHSPVQSKKDRPCVRRRGGFFMGVWGCDEKQIPPPPPFKKGEKKHLIFLTVNDETRPLEIPNKPPLLKGGWGGFAFI